MLEIYINLTCYPCWLAMINGSLGATWYTPHGTLSGRCLTQSNRQSPVGRLFNDWRLLGVTQTNGRRRSRILHTLSMSHRVWGLWVAWGDNAGLFRSDVSHYRVWGLWVAHYRVTRRLASIGLYISIRDVQWLSSKTRSIFQSIASAFYVVAKIENTIWPIREGH